MRVQGHRHGTKGGLAAPSFARSTLNRTRAAEEIADKANRKVEAHQRESGHTLERLRKALLKVARLLDQDPAYAPIFVRLEQEIELEQARHHNDILIRARAVVAQNEIGASKRVTC